MSKQEHTPGPWKLVWWGNEEYPYPLSILSDDDEFWVARDGTVSSEADAHLISAAPDMLSALKDAYRFIADEYGCAKSQALEGEYVSPEARPVWKAICDAIAVAEGSVS